jgi:hypothetical protein
MIQHHPGLVPWLHVEAKNEASNLQPPQRSLASRNAFCELSKRWLLQGSFARLQQWPMFASRLPLRFSPKLKQRRTPPPPPHPQTTATPPTFVARLFGPRSTRPNTRQLQAQRSSGPGAKRSGRRLWCCPSPAAVSSVDQLGAETGCLGLTIRSQDHEKIATGIVTATTVMQTI